jgi:hypothetical protein
MRKLECQRGLVDGADCPSKNDSRRWRGVLARRVSSLLRWARWRGVRRVVTLEGMLVAPRIGIDVDLMAVLGEAVDECDDAGCSGEDCAPLLESEIGRDDRRALLVAPADDVEENVSGSAVAGQVTKFV